VTGKAIAGPLKQRGETFLVEFSPDGKTLVTGSEGLRGDPGDLCVWDTTTWSRRGTAVAQEGSWQFVQFSPTGTSFVTVNADGKIMLWDAVKGTAAELQITSGQNNTCLGFSTDGQILATKDKRGEVQLWDVKTRQPIGPRVRSKGRVETIRFGRDGRTVISLGPDGSARLDPSPRRVRESVTPPNRGSVDVLSPDRRKVLTVDKDSTVRVWNASAYEPDGFRLQHDQRVEVLTYSPDASIIAAGCSDGSTVLWDTKTRIPREKRLKNESAVMALAFSSDGRRLYSADRSTFLQWDPLTGVQNNQRKWESYRLDHIALSPDQGLAATDDLEYPQGGFEPPIGRLSVWRMDRRESQIVASEVSTISDVAFSPDGSLVASAWENGHVLLSAAGGRRESTSILPYPGIPAVAFHPRGTLLATSSGVILQLWDVTRCTQSGDWMQEDGVALHLVFSPDGRILTSQNAERIQLWDIESRSPVGEAIRHPDGINALAFRPDSRELAIASGQLVWRVAVPSPVSGDAPRIALSLQVRTAMTIRDGVIRTLTWHELNERKAALARIGGDCLDVNAFPDSGSTNQGSIVPDRW
jgi:WD40 repeat protein